MARVAPNTVFLFLLNSSGAVIWFVYLLIALSQIILRRRTPAVKLSVKMWFFAVLSILTLLGITAVLVRMAFDHAARSQLWLSLLSWAVVLGLYVVAHRHNRLSKRLPFSQKR
jgi:GABA permease